MYYGFDSFASNLRLPKCDTSGIDLPIAKQIPIASKSLSLHLHLCFVRDTTFQSRRDLVGSQQIQNRR